MRIINASEIKDIEDIRPIFLELKKFNTEIYKSEIYKINDYNESSIKLSRQLNEIEKFLNVNEEDTIENRKKWFLRNLTYWSYLNNSCDIDEVLIEIRKQIAI